MQNDTCNQPQYTQPQYTQSTACNSHNRTQPLVAHASGTDWGHGAEPPPAQTRKSAALPSSLDGAGCGAGNTPTAAR